MQLKEKGHLPRLLAFPGSHSSDNRIKMDTCHLTSHTCFPPGGHANITLLLTSKRETMSSLEVSLMCSSKLFKSSGDSHADVLARVWRKIPAVILWIKHSVLLWAGCGWGGRGHRVGLNLAARTGDFHIFPRPSLANAESLPFLLIYLCHWSKVHKLLPGARSFLIGPRFAAGKVITDGSFCFNFWWRLRGTDVLNISIPSQNQK